MKNISYVILVYAVLLLVGGIIGYVSKNSMPSLAMGSATALIMAAIAWGVHRNFYLARGAALVLSFALALFFALRFANTYSFFSGWPHGAFQCCCGALLCKM